MTIMDQAEPVKKKILFLCPGYALHAFRRIKIFVDDPDFEVSVASNHNYHFTNAENILLKTPLYGKSKTDPYVSARKGQKMQDTLFQKLVKKISGFPLVFNSFLFIYDTFLFIKHLRILKKHVKSCKPDLIFLQTLLYPSYLSLFLSRKIPLIITFWNGDIIWWAKWNGIDRFLKKRIVTNGLKKATAITVNSQSAFDICLSYGVAKEKVHLIRYPGIDLQVFKKTEKAEVRKELGIASEIVILCPRGFKLENDYLNNDIILKSAKDLIKKDRNILFLFVGTNPDQDWENFINDKENLNSSKNFRNDGCVDWQRMYLYYSAADMAVSISSNDSQPNCLLEAMACKTPNIAGDIPQIREWVQDGENGFLVPCRDSNALAQKISQLINMESTRLNEITQNAYDLVVSKADSESNIRLVKNLVKAL
jgi:glycosyltransferase involved in cell wall biosynthesis